MQVSSNVNNLCDGYLLLNYCRWILYKTGSVYIEIDFFFIIKNAVHHLLKCSRQMVAFLLPQNLLQVTTIKTENITAVCSETCMFCITLFFYLHIIIFLYQIRLSSLSQNTNQIKIVSLDSSYGCFLPLNYRTTTLFYSFY